MYQSILKVPKISKNYQNFEKKKYRNVPKVFQGTKHDLSAYNILWFSYFESQLAMILNFRTVPKGFTFLIILPN